MHSPFGKIGRKKNRMTLCRMQCNSVIAVSIVRKILVQECMQAAHEIFTKLARLEGGKGRGLVRQQRRDFGRCFVGVAE